MKKIKCRLAVLMKEKNPRLSQRELSRETGISLSTVNSLHNSEMVRVEVRVVETLCDYFQCGVGDFFVLVDVKNDDSSVLEQ